MAIIPVLFFVISVAISQAAAEVTKVVRNNKSSGDVSRRETVFINNEAVMVDEEELKMIKDLSMKKGLYLSKGRSQQSKNHSSRSSSKIIPERKTWTNNLKKVYNKLNPNNNHIWKTKDTLPEPTVGTNIPMAINVNKTYRFVADPSKAHLSEDVKPDEVAGLESITRTLDKDDGSWSNKMADVTPNQESATIKYEKTHKNFIEVIMGEFQSLTSSLNKRDVYGYISNVLYYCYHWIVDWVNGYKRELLR